MRAIIQSGIKVLKTVRPNFDDPKYGGSFAASHEMAGEAGLKIEFVLDDPNPE